MFVITNIMNNFELEQGKKIPYNIKDIHKGFIGELLKSIGIEEEPTKINTGRKGVEILEQLGEYDDIVIFKIEFDPRVSDSQVNPILQGGYRLSSYIFYVYIEDELIKLIPRNPLIASVAQLEE